MRPLKHLILALAIGSASCICLAQEVAMLIPGGSDMRLPNTLESKSPYPPLRNFNSSLTAQGDDGDLFPEPAIFYSIIPKKILLTAYNTALENNHLHVFNTLMKILSDNIRIYAAKGGVNCNVPATASGIVEASNLALGQLNGWVYQLNHFAARVPPGLTELGMYYLSLPGNSYIGPTRRNDTPPPDTIDITSIPIIGRQQFNILNNSYNALRQYILTRNMAFLTSAINGINTLAMITSIYPLSPSQWVFFNGAYRIRPELLTSTTPETQRSDSKMRETGCNALTPTLDQIRAKLITALKMQ
jgi:hypothetical protein